MLSRGTAGRPWSGSASSWRHAPQCTVTLPVLLVLVVVVLALLLGASWALQLRQVLERLRRAEERRRLDEERSAVCTDRRQRGKCRYCPLSERDCFFAPKIVEERPDDD